MSEREYPLPEKFQDPLENYDPKTYADPLEEALAEHKMQEMQHEPFATTTPETTVAEALELLAGTHVACLLIEEDKKLVGVFSNRDVLDKVALDYDEAKDRPVSEVMTHNPVYVYETDSPAKAFAVMAAAGHRHVPVLNLDEELVGIVSPQRGTAFLCQYFED